MITPNPPPNLNQKQRAKLLSQLKKLGKEYILSFACKEEKGKYIAYAIICKKVTRNSYKQVGKIALKKL
jgi:hypothetical protein